MQPVLRQEKARAAREGRCPGDPDEFSAQAFRQTEKHRRREEQPVAHQVLGQGKAREALERQCPGEPDQCSSQAFHQAEEHRRREEP